MAFSLLTLPALAHDGAHDAWFEGLVVPNRPLLQPMPCCSKTDCQEVRARRWADQGGEWHWEAFIDSASFPNRSEAPAEGYAPDAWVKVADEAVQTGQGNPVGHAVACWWSRKVLCFVPGVEM